MDPRPVTTAPIKARPRGLSWLARLLVVALVLVCSCAGVSAPSLADPGAGDAAATPEELLEAFRQAADSSDAYAVSMSGYSYERENTYPDGGSFSRRGWYHVNDSVRYEELYIPPDGYHKQSVRYIWDSVNKRFSFPRPNKKEARQAYALLGAKDTAWLVRKTSEFPGARLSTEEGAPSWFLMSVLYRMTISGGTISPDGSRLKIDFLPVLASDFPGTMTLSLGSFGEVTGIAYVADDGTRAQTNLVYGPVSIVTPSGDDAVPYYDYEVALQSLTLESAVLYRVTIVTGTAAPATPAKILKLARQQAQRAKDAGLRIPIKVSKIATGARMSARNPFSGATVAYEIVAHKPYPDDSPSYRRIS